MVATCASGDGITSNRTLSERHRVALTSWPINDDPCGTFNSADELFSHARDSGYDGLEVTVDDMRKSFFPGQSYDEIISQVTSLSAKTGVKIVGSLYHVSDGGWKREHEDGKQKWDLDFNDRDFDQQLKEKLRMDRAMGSEYVTFQISLPPRHLNTGGLYRDDTAFIQLSADRIAKMQAACVRALPPDKLDDANRRQRTIVDLG